MSNIYFAGGATKFGAAATTGTGPGTFSQPSGTRSQSSNFPSAPSVAPTPGLAEWLRSNAARSLAGRWVLLSDEFEVIDSAASPGELLAAHPDAASPLVVFVQPPGVELAV